MDKKVAVYAGVFDPPTIGHVWVIEEGLKLFDRLIVAIGANPEKRPLFSTDERLEMLRDICKKSDRAETDHFENEFLVDYAKKKGAGFILRSIRTEGDYEYERVLHHINKDMSPKISAVFLMPPRGLSEVSSSMVKQLVGLDGWEKIVGMYVPPAVLEKLKEKFA